MNAPLHTVISSEGEGRNKVKIESLKYVGRHVADISPTLLRLNLVNLHREQTDGSATSHVGRHVANISPT